MGDNISRWVKNLYILVDNQTNDFNEKQVILRCRPRNEKNNKLVANIDKPLKNEGTIISVAFPENRSWKTYFILY